jgi:hypothetical protein
LLFLCTWAPSALAGLRVKPTPEIRLSLLKCFRTRSASASDWAACPRRGPIWQAQTANEPKPLCVLEASHAWAIQVGSPSRGSGDNPNSVLVQVQPDRFCSVHWTQGLLPVRRPATLVLHCKGLPSPSPSQLDRTVSCRCGDDAGSNPAWVLSETRASTTSPAVSTSLIHSHTGNKKGGPSTKSPPRSFACQP